MRPCAHSLAITVLLAGALLGSANAEVKQATPLESLTVARNWVSYQVASGIFTEHRQVESSHEIVVRGVLVAIAHQLEPAGYVLVPVAKELPPVKAFSASHRFSTESESLGRLVADELHSIVTVLQEVDADPESTIKTADFFGPENRHMWQWLSQDAATFRSGLPAAKDHVKVMPPLIRALWGQGWPFNQYCPTACGEPTAVGCVATGLSQIIHYWRHPAQGTGSHSYLWDGDGCGAAVLSADFSDPYDWDNMVNWVSESTTAEQREAVAELSYEVGVAYESTYGRRGTGAQTARAVDLLPEHFGYSTAVNRKRWVDCGSDEQWFEVFKEQLDLQRPVLLALKGYTEDAPDDLVNHAVGVDGYLSNGELLVHINMGWQHQADDWYALNNIVTANIFWLILEQQFCIRDIFPATCSSPPQPEGFAGDQTLVLSEAAYSLSWEPAAGIDLYEVAEATEPSFRRASRHLVTDGSSSFSREVDEETTYYYRLRGLTRCGPGLMPSEWSETVAVRVVPPNPSEPGDFVYIVPGVARASGASGTEWYTDLSACNMTYWPAELSLTYRHSTGTSSVIALVPAGQMMEWQDVLGSLFGLEEETAGAVEVASDVPLLVSARTFNQGPQGTYGQFMRGSSLEDALSPGVIGVLPQIRKTSGFRTNIGMVNLGSSRCRVRIHLYSATGEELGNPLNVSVPAGSWMQRNQVFSRIGVEECPSGFATVEVFGADARVWVYASVIDNHTGDPTTVPVMIP